MRSLSHLVRMPWIVVWVAAGALSAAAQQTQQTDDLQKQLDQLKQQCDATTRDLEKHIAALEQQIVKQKEANEKTKQGTQEQVSTFEFHGYFRSGYGLNSVGGQQVAFQAPGADAKYRLENEAETYGEFIFVSNWLNPGRSSDRGSAIYRQNERPHLRCTGRNVVVAADLQKVTGSRRHPQSSSLSRDTRLGS